MKTTHSQNPSVPTLLSVEQFVARHSWATVGGLRQLIFREHSNGFAPCVKRLGRRVLLDEAAVFRYIDDPNSVADEASRGTLTAV